MADKNKKATTTTTAAKQAPAAKGAATKAATTSSAVKRATVPELWAKRSQRDEKVRTDKAKAREERRKLNVERKAQWIKNAQAYAKEYSDADRNEINQKRQAKASGSFYVPAEAKVAVIIRIRGTQKLHPDVAKVLRLLRLR